MSLLHTNTNNSKIIIEVTIKLNRTNATMEVDTETTLSVISEQTYKGSTKNFIKIPNRTHAKYVLKPAKLWQKNFLWHPLMFLKCLNIWTVQVWRFLKDCKYVLSPSYSSSSSSFLFRGSTAFTEWVQSLETVEWFKKHSYPGLRPF